MKREARHQQEATEPDAESTSASEAFTAAYNEIFALAVGVWKAKGRIDPELIGIHFGSNRLPNAGAHMEVDGAHDAPTKILEMLRTWPMVAFVCEATIAPDTSIRPKDHPLRQEVVGIALHTLKSTAIASCPIVEGFVVKAPLVQCMPLDEKAVRRSTGERSH